MQINSTFSPQFNNLFKNTPLKNETNPGQETHVTRPTVETAGTVGMTPAELFGRTQVNFCGDNSPNIKLTKYDVNFIKGISSVFCLDKEETKLAETITKTFLEEYGFKSISAMKSKGDELLSEFVNEQACLLERLSNGLGLSDFEENVLGHFIILQSEKGDITKLSIDGRNVINANKYTRDFTPFEYLYQKNGIDDFEKTMNAFNVLRNVARRKNCESVFELFNKDNIKNGYEVIKEFRKPEYGSFGKNQQSEMLLDMIEFSTKTIKERNAGINLHAVTEAFNDGTNTIIIANKISKKYDIELTTKLIDMLDERRTNTMVNQNGKPVMEVAYNITEEYNLPGKAVKEIVQLIEEYENKKDSEKYGDLLDAMGIGNKD